MHYRTEKNCTDWSKAKFKELLVNLQVDSADGGLLACCLSLTLSLCSLLSSLCKFLLLYV
jgi:hypothetical protein